MRSRYLAAALSLSFYSTAGAQEPPLEAFAAPPVMQSPSLSPDGTRLAFISQSGGASYVLVANVVDMTVGSVVDVSASKPRRVTWANEDTLLVMMSETITFGPTGQVESVAPYGVDLAGDIRSRQLLREAPSTRSIGTTVVGGFQFVQGAQLIGYRRTTGEVLFPRFNPDAQRVLYAVNPKSDRQHQIDHGTRFTRDWVVDEDGNPRFRLEYTDKRDQFQLLAKRDGEWVTIVEETVAVPDFAMYGLDADGELVVAVRLPDVGRRGLYILSAETGAIERPLYAHDRLDVSGAAVDPYTNRVVGAVVPGESTVWLDADLAKHQADLDEAFRGEGPTIVSWSQDRTRFVVSTERADRAPAFYLYDAKQLTAKQIGNTSNELDRGKLPPRTPYVYKARDGVEIPGYLTRPLEANGPTPLVVMPHGGPASREVGGYDWFAHYLASRGYAVLQPNFRGSSGYGGQWERAGHGGWGVGVMQHDLTDGVAALVAEGIADPGRVCIVGASYGGYAALAGATFTPELYRCAAAIAPVTDLTEMLGFERNRTGALSATVGYWRQAMGVDGSEASENRLRAASPAQHVDRVQAAILLIHGLDDTVVPIAQSRLMADALRKAGKTVELIELEGEDHWLSGASTRLETLKAVDSFLARYLN